MTEIKQSQLQPQVMKLLYRVFQATWKALSSRVSRLSTSDKSNRGPRDRRVPGRQHYEVRLFARKHDISIDEARKIIARTDSRAEADSAARRSKPR